MSEQIWWYSARATGLVALLLAAASVIWGLIYSSRIMEGRPTLRWTLDLHRYLGALTVTFVAIHMAALVADSYVHFGVSELLVPMASKWNPGAVAWGIVAMYLLVAVQLSSLTMKRLPRRLWGYIHLLSYAVLGLGVAHGFTAGTEFDTPVVVGVTVSATSFAIYLTGLRIARSINGAVASKLADRDTVELLEPTTQSSKV